MMPKPTEKQIQQAILDYLQYRHYFVWRQNSGSIMRDDHFYKTGISGQPDIVGMTKTGHWLGIEVKGEKGKQQQSQIDFEARVKENNGIYILAHSYDEFIKKFDKAEINAETMTVRELIANPKDGFDPQF